MSRTHDQFLGELDASAEAVSHVATWLTSCGVPVVIRPTFRAPTIDDRADFADGGDLEVLLRVEVKCRTFSFTGKDDYPFPTAIVDAVPNFDKKRPVPYGYVLLNETMTAGLWVSVRRTRRHWTRKNLFDRRNGVEQPFYVCPVELLSDISF